MWCCFICHVFSTKSHLWINCPQMLNIYHVLHSANSVSCQWQLYMWQNICMMLEVVTPCVRVLDSVLFVWPSILVLKVPFALTSTWLNRHHFPPDGYGKCPSEYIDKWPTSIPIYCDVLCMHGKTMKHVLVLCQHMSISWPRLWFCCAQVSCFECVGKHVVCCWGAKLEYP